MIPSIVPASQSLPVFKASQTITPVVCDQRAIARLLETIIHKSGLSIHDVAKRLGVTTNTIRQYLHGRRTRPSVQWLVRLAEACGARLVVEFPGSRL